MAKNKDVKFRETKKFFQSLELEGWKECKSASRPGSGGQATVLAVKHTDGTKGAFRYLRSNRPEAPQRFFRELKILTDPQFQHPNIMKIVVCTEDNENHWYISELGKSFPKYWKAQCKKYQNDDPEALLKLAVEIILQILDGLNLLHEQGVIHRDIKPDNIIMKDDTQNHPVLIDFGLTYAEEEGRLTPMDDAVGNIRYSPDVMMYRMDEINPWLDVFQIAQLLIWMISEKPAKDWYRPRDWRWVNYNEKLSDDLVLSIRAITALCSEEQTSPKNAVELTSLIRELVVFTTAEEPKAGIDFGQIKKGISKGKSAQNIEAGADVKIINSSYPLASQTYRMLRDELESIYIELIDSSIPVNKDSDQEFASLYQQAINNPRRNPSIRYRLQIGEEQKSLFHIRVVSLAYLPSVSNRGDPPLPESSNIFAFALQRNSKLAQDFGRTRWLTIERTGEWILRDKHMADPERTDVNQIGKMIRSWISDEEFWEALHRDKR